MLEHDALPQVTAGVARAVRKPERHVGPIDRFRFVRRQRSDERGLLACEPKRDDRAERIADDMRRGKALLLHQPGLVQSQTPSGKVLVSCCFWSPVNSTGL